MQIRWLMSWNPKSYNKTFNPKSIFNAINRLQRYWNVSFVQVTSRPNLTFNLATTNWGQAAAWYSNNVINIPVSYMNFKQDVNIGGVILVHEMGHYFGGPSHAGNGNVMGPYTVGPYTNFTAVDANWFKKLTWKSSLRPWHEPNFWRPAMMGPGDMLDEVKIEFPCQKMSFMDSFKNRLAMIGQKPIFVEND